MSRIVLCRNWLVIAVLVLGVPGCGRDPYGQFTAVTGTLLCDGEPAVGATVIFSPDDAPDKTGRLKGNPGPSSRGVVQEDGTFSLITWNYKNRPQTTGALVGPHTVHVEPPMTKRPALNPGQAGLPPKERAEVEAKLDALPIYEPLDCGTKEVTPATVEVSSDQQQNNFELSLGGQAPQRPPLARTPGGRQKGQ